MSTDPRLKPDTPIPNVIVFGESGGGKSSVINMLDGGPPVGANDRLENLVFNHTACEKTISGRTYRVFDTVGLNKPSKRRWWNKKDETREQLIRLITKLDTGLSLLVYVIQAPRIPGTVQENYQIFFDLVCQKQVPIVIVVTGLENRCGMDGWWDDNQSEFGKRQICFSGFACITTSKRIYEKEYEESKRKVEGLISSWCGEAWKVDAKEPRSSVIIDAVHRMLGRH